MSDLKVKLTAPNGKTYDQPIGLFIDNEWHKSSDEGKIASVNPSNEQEITSVYAATKDDVDKAVAAARKAFKSPGWRDMDPSKRAQLMYNLATLIRENEQLLATVETWDNGKPFRVALAVDVHLASETIRYYAGWADKLHGQTIPTGPLKFAYTIREPVGVVGQIIPWNFPLLMAAWKLGPALACGNTVVLKPAEQTPLSILLLADLVAAAGFPAGVVNIINGHGRQAGAALASHPHVDKVAFTGSTATGAEIMKLAAPTLKNITLETGGKSALLVFPDADLDQAVKYAHAGIMSNAGQVCTATSRVLVHRSVAEEFHRAFLDVKSVLGDPYDPQTTQGPQVSRQQFERVLSYVKTGTDEGATLLAGGQPDTAAGKDGKGFYIAPTVFTDVQKSHRIFREEVFGPFVVIVPFDSEEEAIDIANETEYGLGASVFTTNLARAHRVASRLHSGSVWVNSANDSDYRVPFGGVKMSGIGRELGEAGLEAYTVKKAVHVNLGNRK